MGCSPLGSSVHGIFHARILEWVAISSSRGSSHPGMEAASLASPALAGRFFTTGPPGKPIIWYNSCYYFNIIEVVYLSVSIIFALAYIVVKGSLGRMRLKREGKWVKDRRLRSWELRELRKRITSQKSVPWVSVGIWVIFFLFSASRVLPSFPISNYSLWQKAKRNSRASWWRWKRRMKNLA